MIRKPTEMQSEVRENMRGGPGSAHFRHLFDKQDFEAPVRLCAEITLPPGSGIGAHQHLAEDEIFIILKGQGIIDDGKSKNRVTAGDSILTGRGESHSILNDATTDLVFIAMICCYPQKQSLH